LALVGQADDALGQPRAVVGLDGVGNDARVTPAGGDELLGGGRVVAERVDARRGAGGLRAGRGRLGTAGGTGGGAAAAERTTGYVRGGISPLGQRRRLRTVVDSSALEHPTVFVSAGKRGLEVELAPRDLLGLTDAVVAPIGRA